MIRALPANCRAKLRRFCRSFDGAGMSEHYDVVIAGGAVMGSSVAYHLATQPAFQGRILVIEPDMTYARSASALSASSIRQQFSSPVNIRISLFGIAFLRNIQQHLTIEDDVPNIGLKEGGYLYLSATNAGAALLKELNTVQRSEGADIALLEPALLKEKFPYLQTDDLTMGSFGLSGEGWFDGYGLLQAFRKKARSLGVTYHKAKVTGLERSGSRVTSVTLDGGSQIPCGAFVNTSGASGARAVASMAGVDIPVFAKKRCVFPFTCKTPTPNLPLLIDTSGIWVRPEGDGYIAGFSPDDLDETDSGTDFEVDWSIFEDIIWPALAQRIPAFEAIKPGNPWAGHYDMCLLDHNAIIGRLGGLDNAYIAAGFSGHGLQQSPAVGRGLAELISTGNYLSLDLSALGFDRIIKGEPLLERNVI
jgi:FAD-dependent oxidoreductase domain-containing protein 1